jgi:hypothetical protein
MIDHHTRERFGQEPSLLDLLLVNDNENIVNTKYLDPLGSSDHCVIEFNYKCYFSYDQTQNERLNYYKANYDEMRKELYIDWEKELGDSNPIEMLITFMEKLNKTIDKNIPKSKPRNTKGSIHLSKETVQNIKRKHRLWERYMEDRSKEKHREYCKARNKVKRLTRRDRKEREKQIAESAKTNSKNFWKFVKSKRKTKTGVPELHDKSVLYLHSK